jgi:hypothetical protein
MSPPPTSSWPIRTWATLTRTCCCVADGRAFDAGGAKACLQPRHRGGTSTRRAAAALRTACCVVNSTLLRLVRWSMAGDVHSATHAATDRLGGPTFLPNHLRLRGSSAARLSRLEPPLLVHSGGNGGDSRRSGTPIETRSRAKPTTCASSTTEARLNPRPGLARLPVCVILADSVIGSGTGRKGLEFDIPCEVDERCSGARTVARRGVGGSDSRSVCGRVARVGSFGSIVP